MLVTILLDGYFSMKKGVWRCIGFSVFRGDLEGVGSFKLHRESPSPH